MGHFYSAKAYALPHIQTASVKEDGYRAKPRSNLSSAECSSISRPASSSMPRETLFHVSDPKCVLRSPPDVVFYELRQELAYKGGSCIPSHPDLFDWRGAWGRA
jgi:hypothetical protein